ncbi:unnamed protein product, partial [Phyllotreta striolata]
VSILVQVYCRPQNPQNDASPALEAKNIENIPKIVESKTQEIIEKIAEVNKKHGLEPKNQKPNGTQNSLSVARSQNNVLAKETPRSEFRFPTNPFSNPILEFLEREKVDKRQAIVSPQPMTYAIDNRQSQDVLPSQGFEITSTNHHADISPEDLIPGQQVTRKIVHQQTVLVPNPYYGLSNQYSQPLPVYPNYPLNEQPTQDRTYLNNLEKQTITNVRNIISNSQAQTYPTYYAPIQGNPNNQPSYGYIIPIRNTPGQEPSGLLTQLPSGAIPSGNPETARQNWNWPGADYFPIFIKDPFLQMYNAVTTMVEYGPNAGSQNPCSSGNRKPPKQKLKNDNLLREGKTSEQDTKISVELDGKGGSPQISINADHKNGTYLDIENIDIGAYGDNSLKFTLNLKNENPETKEDVGTGRTSWDKVKVAGKSNSLVLNPAYNSSRTSSKFSDFQKELRPLSVIRGSLPSKQSSSSAILSPPTRDPSHQTHEFGDESEEEKSEELISNDNNKKLFSRDNTGSGVFIHKLKVRKGGVAIAGPGGIATAGSGGTAIVGPGGIAYTQPDSLAIAGSGTKVVAVDPTINLGELANNTSLLANRTRYDFPPSRIAKEENPPIDNTITQRTETIEEAPDNSKLIASNPPSLAPYRFHPLFNYLKNGHTISKDNVIKFRGPESEENKDVTTLILKPVARSVAGVEGRAMATPVSKAILRKGMSVDILFEPDAIAIAGPGGIAHAESDLEISYEDD